MDKNSYNDGNYINTITDCDGKCGEKSSKLSELGENKYNSKITENVD